VLSAALALKAVSAYESEIEKWLHVRATALKAEGGWLTVVGLFWLEPGANQFGRDAGNAIVLPDTDRLTPELSSRGKGKSRWPWMVSGARWHWIRRTRSKSDG
jgi:hypothetical protein